MKPARLRVLTLLAVLVLALAGCIRPISGTGKTIEPPDYDTLVETNRIMNLLGTSRALTMTQTHLLNGQIDSLYMTEYFVDDPGVLTYSANSTVDLSTGEKSVWPDSGTFWDGERVLYVVYRENGPSATTVVPGKPDADPGYPGDDFFIYDLYNVPFTDVTELDGKILFRAAPEILEGGYLDYAVEKETGRILSVDQTSADGTEKWVTEVDYSGSRISNNGSVISDNMKKYREEIGNMRECVIHLWYLDGSEFKQADLWYHIPAAWEMTFIPEGDLVLYDSENFNNPVDGIAAPGTGKIEFWASAAKG